MKSFKQHLLQEGFLTPTDKWRLKYLTLAGSLAIPGAMYGKAMTDYTNSVGMTNIPTEKAQIAGAGAAAGTGMGMIGGYVLPAYLNYRRRQNKK
jgi:hypothetical protein